MRSVQEGPIQAVVASTLVIGVYFKLPAGAVLTYASVSPISINVPPVGTTITLYYSKDEDVTTYPYPLKSGYSARDLFRPKPLIWQGKHKLQSNYEHTLELSVHNQTGAEVTIQGICVYEVEEND